MTTADKKTTAKKTQNKPAADATTAPTKTKYKKQPKGIAKINLRSVKTREWITQQLVMITPPADANDPISTLRRTVSEALTACDVLLAEVSGSLLKLTDAGWKLPHLGASAKFAVDDTVRILPKRMAKFTKDDAYSVEALGTLKVVSIHGSALKLKTAAGEHLGIVPAKWVGSIEKTRRGRE